MEVKGLIAILFIVWLMLMAGCWIIGTLIVALWIYDPLITGAIKALSSSLVVLVWLLCWRKLAFSYFWFTLRKRRKG